MREQVVTDGLVRRDEARRLAVGGQLEEDLRAKYRAQLAEMQKIIAEALPRVDVPTNYVAWTLNAPAGSRIHAHTAGGDLRPVPAKVLARNRIDRAGAMR